MYKKNTHGRNLHDIYPDLVRNSLSIYSSEKCSTSYLLMSFTEAIYSIENVRLRSDSGELVYQTSESAEGTKQKHRAGLNMWKE